MLQIILTRKSMRTNASPLFLPLSIVIAAMLLLGGGVLGITPVAHAQETVQVSASNYVVDSGGSIDVAIDLSSESVSVAALKVEVTYDPAVVAQTSCALVDFTGACNEPSPGQVLITGVNIEGNTGSSQIATVSFDSISTPGSSTPLQLVISTLVDAAATPLDHSITDGTILTRQSVDGQTSAQGGAQGGAQSRVYLPMVGRNSFKNANGEAVDLSPVDVVMTWVCAFMANFGWESDECFVELR